MPRKTPDLVSALPEVQATVSTSPPVNTKARRNASVACQACRQSRARCSGHVPCTACIARKIECVIQIDNDGRRKESRKRAIKDLQDDSDLLGDLILTLKNSGDVQVAEIVSLIRGKAPVHEVKDRIRQQMLENQWLSRETSPDLERAFMQVEKVPHDQADAHPSSRQKVMDIARLTDHPPCRVPASPWTTVTNDDMLVSHLVSMWLLWDKSFFNWVDEEPFLRDMRLGYTNSAFCSPFLVNALLASACFAADYDEARARRGVESKLMLDFLREAERLLGEDDSVSLTKAQGLAFLFRAVGSTGQDAVCYKYFGRAVTMVKDLVAQHDDAATDEMSRALEVTCWGLFNMSCLGGLGWCKPVLCQPPSIPMPQPKDSELDWIPYPRSHIPITSYKGECLFQYAQLSMIAKEIATLLHEARQQQKYKNELVGASCGLRKQLKDWRQSLPIHLELSAASPPSVLTLHSYALLLFLYLSPLLNQATHDPTTDDVTASMEASRNAALEIVQICKYYRAAYGATHMNVMLVQPITFALYTLCDETDDYTEKICDLCEIFRALGRRWPFAMAAFRMFQLSASRRQQRLPEKIVKLFEDFERREWNISLLEKVDSIYPHPGDKIDGRREVRTMSEFFQAMKALEVGEKSEESG